MFSTMSYADSVNILNRKFRALAFSCISSLPLQTVVTLFTTIWKIGYHWRFWT